MAICASFHGRYKNISLYILRQEYRSMSHYNINKRQKHGEWGLFTPVLLSLISNGLYRLYVTGLFEVFGDGDNLEVAALDELEYLGTLGRLVNVGFDALEGVEYRCAGLIEVTVTLGDVVDSLLGETAVLAQQIGVDTKVACGIVGHDTERGHVACNAASALDEHPFTDLGVLVDHDARREDGVASNLHVAGYRDVVADDHTVLYVRVVADVRVGHERRARADACATLSLDAAVDDDVFTYHHVVTDVAVGEATFPAEILGVGTYNRALIYFAVFTHAGAADDACKWHNHATVAYLHVLVDVGKRMDGDVVANFG